MSNIFLLHRFLSTRDRLVRGIGSELRPRGCAAQAADEVPVRRMGMIDELASAVRTRGHLQHVGLEKTQECPCAGDAQDRFQSDCPDLVEVEPIGGDERHDALPFRALRGPVVQVHEERGMEVWLPSHEPLGGKRKKSPRGRLLADLMIEPPQTLTRQCRLCLEHLHSGPQADEAVFPPGEGPFRGAPLPCLHPSLPEPQTEEASAGGSSHFHHTSRDCSRLVWSIELGVTSSALWGERIDFKLPVLSWQGGCPPRRNPDRQRSLQF